jgi:GR25 family glycosyltransferase involved in LPS biosynthesis
MCMKMLPAFVINLDHDKSRWKNIVELFSIYISDITRVPAVNGVNLKYLDQYIDWKMWLIHEPKKYNIKSHVGCFLSHRKAWEMIAEQSAPWALVLEDDMCPTDELSGFLQAFAKNPPPIDIVRLNTNSQSRLPKRQLSTGMGIGGIELVVDPLGARSSGAYLISRNAARLCLAYKRMIAPVDHFEWLFQQHGMVHVHTRRNVVEQSHLFESNITPSTKMVRLDSLFSQFRLQLVRYSYVRRLQARNLATARMRASAMVKNTKD